MELELCKMDNESIHILALQCLQKCFTVGIAVSRTIVCSCYRRKDVRFKYNFLYVDHLSKLAVLEWNQKWTTDRSLYSFGTSKEIFSQTLRTLIHSLTLQKYFNLFQLLGLRLRRLITLNCLFIPRLALLAHITLQYVTNKLIYILNFTFKKHSYCQIVLQYLLFGYLLATSDLISCVLPENH